MNRFVRTAFALILTSGLVGCASYRQKVLPSKPELASSIKELKLDIPSGSGHERPRHLKPEDGVSIGQIGLLAILNDPDLKVERGQLGLAMAALLSATLLPNPRLGFGFGALISGPGSVPSYTASLSQDVASLITYRPRIAAARAQLHSVSAELLWQEWQVAEQARLLAAEIYGADQDIRYRQQALKLLSSELKDVSQATALYNLDLAAEAPLIAARAVAQTRLANAQLKQVKAWQRLDALLGLKPSVRFEILKPKVVRPPADIRFLIRSLPLRRPDLIALRFAYHASDEHLRAALLGQFPPLVFGATGATDTSNVLTIGPQLTISLPFFNRNQGEIASARASRTLLRAKYRAALDRSAGSVEALDKRVDILSTDVKRAAREARRARRLMASAEQAYNQGTIDQRTLVDYQTTALNRELDATNYDTRLVMDELALEVELGLGLPQTRIIRTSNRE